MESVICPIAEHAAATPEQPAIFTDRETLTYQELHKRVCSLETFLQAQKIQRGERVAFIAEPSIQGITLFFALFRLGAIAAPLSHRLPKEQLPGALKALSATRFLESVEYREEKALPTFHISLEQMATFLFTSGSSGTPKVACHSFSNHYYSALGAISSLSVTSKSRWQLSLPLFHVSGIAILFRIFFAGGALILTDKTLPSAISSFQITHLSLVPTQLMRLLNEEAFIGTSLQCILLGGAPLAIPLFEKAMECKLPLYTTFGMTEMSSLITLSPPEELKKGLNAGKSVLFREIEIRNGEIFVRGKTLFQGYWDASAEVCNAPEEWFATKDLGSIDAYGNLNITGRKDRQFISGGENIQPEEIESALLQVPGILRAAVLPVKDEEFGMRPVAFIEDETKTHTLASVREHLNALLPSFKHPIQLLPFPEGIEGIKPNLSQLKSAARSLFQI